MPPLATEQNAFSVADQNATRTVAFCRIKAHTRQDPWLDVPSELKDHILSFISYDYPHIRHFISRHALDALASTGRSWRSEMEDHCRRLLMEYGALPGQSGDGSLKIWSPMNLVDAAQSNIDTVANNHWLLHLFKFPTAKPTNNGRMIRIRLWGRLNDAKQQANTVGPHADPGAVATSYRTARLDWLRWHCILCYDFVTAHRIYSNATLFPDPRSDKPHKGGPSTGKAVGEHTPRHVATFRPDRIICSMCCKREWPDEIKWENAKKKYDLTDAELMWPIFRMQQAFVVDKEEECRIGSVINKRVEGGEDRKEVEKAMLRSLPMTILLLESEVSRLAEELVVKFYDADNGGGLIDQTGE